MSDEAPPPDSAPRAKMGRPRKLAQDPKLTGRICARLRRGVPPEIACERYGVTRQSLYNWLREGEAHAAQGLETPEADFFYRVKRAVAVFFCDCVEKVREAGDGWQAWAWLLERRGREHFARPTSVEVSGPGGKPMQIESKVIDVRSLPLDELERLARGELPPGEG